jgi:hypothetical protein
MHRVPTKNSLYRACHHTRLVTACYCHVSQRCSDPRCPVSSQAVMDGDLDGFMTAYLQQKGVEATQEKLEELAGRSL